MAASFRGALTTRPNRVSMGCQVSTGSAGSMQRETEPALTLFLTLHAREISRLRKPSALSSHPHFQHVPMRLFSQLAELTTPPQPITVQISEAIRAKPVYDGNSRASLQVSRTRRPPNISVGKVGMLTPSGRLTCKRDTRNAIAAAPTRTMPRLFIITGLPAVGPKPHPVPARASV
jgi:hypothetical protein